MNYQIKRGDQEFGPYSLADLQRYVQDGHVSPDDMAQSEGMTEWIPVSQVLGDIPNSVATAPIAVDPALLQQVVPLPPNLPWPVLLLIYFSGVPYLKIISLLTIVWTLIQANWARKLNGKNTALVLAAMYVTGAFSGGFLAGIAATTHQPALVGFGGLLILAGSICFIISAFKIRDAMEEYYNSVENIGLSMSGAMTFFFNVIYIQYHINRIARMKKSGELP